MKDEEREISSFIFHPSSFKGDFSWLVHVKFADVLSRLKIFRK